MDIMGLPFTGTPYFSIVKNRRGLDLLTAEKAGYASS
jgi:hypothetical protein